MDQYIETIRSTIAIWVAAASEYWSRYAPAVGDLLSSPANRQTIFLGGAFAMLAVIAIVACVKLRRARAAVRRLTAELDDTRSKYDAEIRWRLARERHENKSQSQSKNPSQLAS